MLISRIAQSVSSTLRVATIAAVAAGLAVITRAPDAVACDCAIPEFAAPGPSDAAVPSNTKVWLAGFGCDNPTLRKTDGTVVAISVTSLDQASVIHPEAPLEVGSTYEVVDCFGGDAAATSFTVTEGPDDEAPPTPTFTADDRESGSSSGSSCGDYEYVPLLVSQQGVLLTLDVAGQASLDPETLGGNVVDLFFPDEKAAVGNRTCGTNNWNFEEDGEAVDTRLGALDFAGNFSGWSEPQALDAGCGCEAAGADPAPARGYGLGALMLGALTLLRRRRA